MLRLNSMRKINKNLFHRTLPFSLENGQKGNVVVIVVVLVVLGVIAFLGFQYLNKTKAPTQVNPVVKPVNLEVGRKLPPAQVKITKSGFTPSTIEVKAGQTL